MKIQFNPEKIWLDRIEGQRKPGGCCVNLAGKHAIPTAQLTEQICLRIMETRTGNWRNELSDVPLHLRTPAVCLAAIKVLSSDASDIPREVWTPEFIERAFAVLPCGDHLLRYIPGELITADICRHCVETNGYALTDVPNHLKTDDLCLEAVRRNGSAIAFVPEHLRTMENFRIAAASNPFGAMRSISRHEVAAEEYVALWRIAIQKNGRALEEMTELAPDLIDAGIVAIAVQTSPYAIRHVPNGFATAALLLTTVMGATSQQQLREDGVDGGVIACGPLSIVCERWPEKVTEALCLAAVEHRWQSIVDVPEAMLTERIIMAAFRQHPAALDWAPKEVMVTMPNVVTEWVRSDLNRIAEITNPEVFRKVAEALGLDVVSS